jgi:hypothetical protein
MAALLAIAALWLASSAVATGNYGKLLARHNAAPASTLETHFGRVAPSSSFLLVVTEHSRTQLDFSWSVHCFDPAHKASGGASGKATVVNGHWVKRVRADWIKHPAYCMGSVEGSASASPVLVRVFAD